MKAFPMSEIRKIFPEELTKIEKGIKEINNHIKDALKRKEREITYLINNSNKFLSLYDIDKLCNIYGKEGYIVRSITDSFGIVEIIICW